MMPPECIFEDILDRLSPKGAKGVKALGRQLRDERTSFSVEVSLEGLDGDSVREGDSVGDQGRSASDVAPEVVEAYVLL